MTAYLTIFDNIFRNQDESLSFLLDNEIIPRFLNCRHCMGISGTMQIRNYRINNTQTVIYRCTRCNARKGMLSLGVFKSGKLKLNTYLASIYFFVLYLKVVQVYNLLDISMNAYMLLRDKMSRCSISSIQDIMPRIGGPETIVEMDEMAFRRGQLVSNPTSEGENERDTCWIIGGIQRRRETDAEDTQQAFFIKIIPNRRAESMAEIIRLNILPNTIIHSDSHRSYPAAINYCNVHFNMNLRHEMVNHSVEYVSESGIHTNNIENLWSHVRSYWRSRHGVIRDQLPSFLAEFTYLKHFVQKK